MNADSLEGEWDYVIVHDPQPVGMKRGAQEHGKHWIWRCHIDLSEPNPDPIERLAAADRRVRRQRLAHGAVRARRA